MNELADKKEEQLYRRVTEILGDARGRVARTVNAEMVNAYWRIGREIVEVEQAGEARAGYADELIVRLSARLSERFGRSLGTRSLWRMRQFYLTYENGSQLVNPRARAFYEIEASRESWSVRELERQVAAMLFERLALKGDETHLATHGQQIAHPRDVIKDPFVLEFLDLKEPRDTHERDIEQVIIDRLEDFMLELGKGFCFVGRQKRVTLDGDHFYVDLVFYNRILTARYQQCLPTEAELIERVSRDRADAERALEKD